MRWRVFLLDGQHLQKVRAHLGKGDRSFDPALAALKRDAQAALKAGSYSVVNKRATPPSGDKHDYMSQATYFWPNPKTPNGLPYIRRDGEGNPETGNLPDHAAMNKMESEAATLAMAYYFTGDEKYAAKASQLLRAWFLDPATRMNPNLQYAQAIPGVNTGRGIGIIDTHGLADLLDYVGLLAGSTAWTASDQRGLEKWFSEYLQWLRVSKQGRQESAEKNNHGTYYDLQVAAFALFTGNEKLAVKVLRNVGPKRISVQIEPDGPAAGIGPYQGMGLQFDELGRLDVAGQTRRKRRCRLVELSVRRRTEHSQGARLCPAVRFWREEVAAQTDYRMVPASCVLLAKVGNCQVSRSTISRSSFEITGRERGRPGYSALSATVRRFRCCGVSTGDHNLGQVAACPTGDPEQFTTLNRGDGLLGSSFAHITPCNVPYSSKLSGRQFIGESVKMT